MENTISIEDLLEETIQKNASDLHLSVGKPPMLRIDGLLVPVDKQPVLRPADTEALALKLVDESQKEILIKNKEVDFSFAYGDVARFRVNAFHQRGVIGLALRLIPNKIRGIEELGLPKVVNSFADVPRGLVLFTGPTGSGKSTSMAALINIINENKALHIITIEDPIEYNHSHKKSIVDQREVHYDTMSFGMALRSVLREDPDVVLIGEMRDLETISSAITIAETGHLVFATLHTNSAATTVDRIIDVFPAHQQDQIRTQLAGVLQAIVAQRLIPQIGGGRLAAAEILIVTPAVRNIVREGKTHQLDAVIQTGAEKGMQSMDKTLATLVRSGKVTQDEAENYALDLGEFQRMVRG
jgi:twitching motility protein PilT